MRTKQTRKSVSITGELYAELKQHCERESISMSGYFENLGRVDLGMPARPATRKQPPVIGDAIDVPVSRKLGPPPVTLKIDGPPVNGTNVEVIRTEVHVAVNPQEQLKLDRAKQFKEWDEKQRSKVEPKRDGSNIFTF
jgi:hypothetical protein